MVVSGWFAFDLKSPAAAPSIAAKAGVFGEDCLSAESASSAAARFGEKHREAEGRGGGCSFLWLLSFEQAKESDSPVARKRLHNKQNHPLTTGTYELRSLYGSNESG